MNGGGPSTCSRSFGCEERLGLTAAERARILSSAAPARAGQGAIQGGMQMARRSGAPLHWAKYCVNLAEKEIHDLDNEQRLCHIERILAAGQAKPYHSLNGAYADGHRDCEHCLP